MLRLLTRRPAARGGADRLRTGGVTVAVALLACGCGSASAPSPSTPVRSAAGSGPAGHTGTPTSSSPAPATGSRATAPTRAARDHLASDLEGRLPATVDGVRLTRVSTTGAAIFAQFGGTAWSRQMTAYLHRAGKTPADLRYAQAFDPSKRIALDAGVFQLTGVPASVLRTAIVNSSRPDSPGLSTSPAKVGGKPVTAETDPGSGSTVYLYAHDGAVFYVDGSNQHLAATFLDAVR